MSIGTVLKSQKTTWLAGALAVLAATVLGFWLAGWFGIGTVGVFGLLISASVAFGSGRADVGDYINIADASRYTKGVAEERRAQASPEQKMAAEAARKERSRVVYLINTVFIALTALGFWMFIQHDLQGP